MTKTATTVYHHSLAEILKDVAIWDDEYDRDGAYMPSREEYREHRFKQCYPNGAMVTHVRKVDGDAAK
jgi:hypothetical protein